ncbi:GNAT family N-acetyltransferase [Alloiococcus sp. CFN-8]|uniref:GNAT family N-acetyltransferase n=1 Tax=Alloiococcus sp. CFN-8 TaxID=3416081 RepID=UPI003CF843BD
MKKETKITLAPLQESEKEAFILNIQAAFKKAVVEEFGDDGTEVIPREDIIQSFEAKGAESYNIIQNGEVVGGAVIAVHPDTNRNELLLLFVNVDCHSKGVGVAAWKAIEELHPETEVWITHTPYFEKRNIHFYVNKCGFHIVEFFNPHHPMPNHTSMEAQNEEIPGGDYFLRFEKKMK